MVAFDKAKDLGAKAIIFTESNLNSSRELPVYLTLKEVAELLKVKPRTVYARVSVEEFRTSVGGAALST